MKNRIEFLKNKIEAIEKANDTAAKHIENGGSKAYYNREIARRLEILNDVEKELAILIGKRIKKAIDGALVSRGKHKGQLLAKCPPVNTDSAAVWQAIVSLANPYKVGMGHMMFMDKERVEIYNAINKAIIDNNIDVRRMDRDREVLDLILNIW